MTWFIFVHFRNLNDETSKGRTISRYEPPTRPIPPPGVADFDLENWEDPGQASEYAMDIFVYYKTREVQQVFSIYFLNG